MIQYPSIPSWREVELDRECIPFYKYDGSNLRWEWSPKKGWYKFGTRTRLFDKTTELYNQAIPLFIDEGIGDIVVSRVRELHKKNPQRIVAFTEFFGQNSFAGSHLMDDFKYLKLFDVHIFGEGLLPAKTFCELFDPYLCTALVYVTPEEPVIFSQEFINRIRLDNTGRFIEGVVCKGNGWMAKVKTEAYLSKLKLVFQNKWEDYA